VLPTYDRPDRLQQAVESVAAQTYDDVELVVVDDHSPTPAAATLSDTTANGIDMRIVRHETNKGANEARNTGIAEASGEYVAFLDDDDEWHPDKLTTQVHAFREGDDRVGVVYTGTTYDFGMYELTQLDTLSGDITEELLCGGSIGEFSTLLVDAETIASCGDLDTRFPSWQDREWLVRLSTHCTVTPVEKPLTIRRRSDDEASITDNFEEKRDVSYPLFIDKHQALAASYGVKAEFIASLSATLGKCALKNGYYADGRKYLLKALYYDPLNRSQWIYALLSLGGRYTYDPASALAHTFHRVDASAVPE
jgi:glycosyltransferase involved in cell wall biosynthesis